MARLARGSILLALIPAIAFAGPRGRRKPPKKPPPAAEPAPAPTPTPTPAPATTPAGAAPATPPGTPPAAPNGGAGAGSGANGTAGSGAGAPAMVGPDKPEPGPEKPAPSGNIDVDTLRQEYLSLRDELFKSRARANTVASQLYSTRIQIKLTYTTARFYNPTKASIRLDGATVYEDSTGAIGGDDGVRFDGYVAPGRHLVTFRVEATGKDDGSFGSTTESQIVVKAVPGKDLVVAAKAKDGGDISYEWQRSERGSYGLGIDVSVKTVARPGDKAASK
ncbi:MAG: hypothetical protein AB7R00_00920 [Kofleriaceae bacterium]